MCEGTRSAWGAGCGLSTGPPGLQRPAAAWILTVLRAQHGRIHGFPRGVLAQVIRTIAASTRDTMIELDLEIELDDRTLKLARHRGNGTS